MKLFEIKINLVWVTFFFSCRRTVLVMLLYQWDEMCQKCYKVAYNRVRCQKKYRMLQQCGYIYDVTWNA